MSLRYKPTALEQWVETRCKRIGIYTPSDIKEEYIAKTFGITFLREERERFQLMGI